MHTLPHPSRTVYQLSNATDRQPSVLESGAVGSSAVGDSDRDVGAGVVANARGPGERGDEGAAGVGAGVVAGDAEPVAEPASKPDWRA